MSSGCVLFMGLIFIEPQIFSKDQPFRKFLAYGSAFYARNKTTIYTDVIHVVLETPYWDTGPDLGRNVSVQ